MFYRILISMVLVCLLVNFALANPQATNHENSNPVVSNHALGLLSAVVLQKPAESLFPATANMHDYQLSVRDIEKLSRAGTIIWLGSQHEPGLAKLSKRFPDKHWLTVGSEVEHEWLEPEGAFRILVAIADGLKISSYGRKVEAFKNQLYETRQQWRELFKPLKDIPFLVGHSAVAVLAKDLGLENIKTYSASGSHGHHHGGTSELLEIQTLIANGDLYCAIEEPDVSFSQLKKRFPQLQSVSIDPMGGGLAPSEQAFLQYYDALVEGLYLCLTIR